MAEHDRQSNPPHDGAGDAENSDRDPSHDLPDAMPAGLQEDLASLFGRGVDSSTLDQSIAAMARTHFDAVSNVEPVVAEEQIDTRRIDPFITSTPAPLRAWWARWRVAEVGGLAAAIGLIVWISLFSSQPKTVLVGDVDRNGTVNILDAYQLQRDIEAGGELPNEWDVTGDGAVNRDDVTAVASLAVKLAVNLDGGKPS